jgi:hypothetical protein
VYPQEHFAYYKRPFWHVLCLKRIGLPCCTFVTVTVTYSLQIILLPNYSLLIISVLAENTLLKIACHFLLLLVGFDTLTYRKDYDWSPILVGHHPPPFIGHAWVKPLPGYCRPGASGFWEMQPNNLLPTISVLAVNTLLKTTCHFLLLLVGFDTLTYRKDYDTFILHHVLLLLFIMFLCIIMILGVILMSFLS